MSANRLARLTNIALRGMTLGSKFVLIFVLAKLLEPAEVGLYGLLTVTIGYMLMALGFDFYSYATRELINAERKDWGALLRDQGVFYGITYAVILPLSLFVFWFGFLPWSLALWFFPLLVLEHVAQEFNRLLVAMSEPLWASIVLFARQGLWAIVAAVWMWLVPEQRSLTFVFAAWSLGGLLACVIAAARLRGLDGASLARAIDWSWIKRGVLVATPFVLATLSLRALYTFDRYLIEALSGLEVLAAYVLYMGIANVIMTFLDASVFTFIYPALIAAAGKRDQAAFDKHMQRLTRQTFVLTLGLSLAVILLAKPLFAWLDKPVYSQYFSLLYWAVLAAALFSISMIPHYGLYAHRRDRPIILSHLASLPIFAIAVYLFSTVLREAAIPAAMAFTFLFLLFTKTLFFRRCTAFATL
ncbi:MAG: oligosaccharide flippase family protein [Candidatus Saccharibacteria bacterium]|nr:oligosaccharide flippase family protein [Rhodoferax sp.]